MQRSDVEARQQEINEVVIQLVADLLELDARKLNPTKSFLDYGADSIMFVNLVRKIDERLNVRLKVRQLFEELTNVERLTAYLSSSTDAPPARAAQPAPDVPSAEPPPVPVRSAAAPETRSSAALVTSAPKDGANAAPASEQNAIRELIAGQLALMGRQLEILARDHGEPFTLPITPPAPAAALPHPAPAKQAVSGGFWSRPREGRRAESRSMPAGHEQRLQSVRTKQLAYSVYFFGAYRREFQADKYELVFAASREADRLGYEAVWFPERHFHEFGGISPNPALLAAAVARTTERIALRAGSVVVPLHHPARIAEEWSVVENLAPRRVGLALASGWHPRDFVLGPDRYKRNRELTFEAVPLLRQLWRGATVAFPSGDGKAHDIAIFPSPCDPAIPLWLTIVNNTDTFRKAGELGVGVLTNLMGQSIGELESNIAVYLEAYERAGHNPSEARVTVLLHTYLAATVAEARARAAAPLKDYFRSTVALFQSLVKAQGLAADFEALTEADREYIFDRAFARYVETSALIGTTESVVPIVEQLRAIGVTEIGSLIDFGLPLPDVISSVGLGSALIKRECAAPNAGPADAVYEVPLTAMQKQMLLLTQFGEGALQAYNECVCFRLHGAVDAEALAAAVNAVVARHESLRAAIDGEREVMRVFRDAKTDLQQHDLATLSGAEQQRALEALLLAESNHRFDLSQAPVCRVSLIRLQAAEAVLVINNHHLLSDGWSMGCIIRELGEAYNAMVEGAPLALPAPALYGDYVAAFARRYENSHYADDERYWCGEFATPVSVAEMPSDFSRPPVKTFRGARTQRRIDRALVGALRRHAAEAGASLFMMVFAAYALFVSRIARQSDVVIGVPSAGRGFRGAESLVGYCLNLLPIRLQITPDAPFGDLLAQVRTKVLGAFDHQDYAYADLIEKVAPSFDASRTPLCSAVLTYNETTIQAPQFKQVRAEVLAPPIAWAKHDWHLILLEEAGDLLLSADFNLDLYRPETIAQWLESFEGLLAAIVADADAKQGDLSLLSARQRAVLTRDWGHSVLSAPPEQTIVERFERACELHGARPAIRHRDATWSYVELKQGVDALAASLRKQGVAPGDVIALALGREPAYVTAVLAVLRCGAAYMPVDATLPTQRIRYMAEVSKAKVLLAHDDVARTIADEFAVVISIDAAMAAGGDVHDAVDDGVTVTGESPAYVMFTSGSTGQPKGTVVPHRGVMRLLTYAEFEPGQRMLLASSLLFDASVLEMFGALLNGLELVIYPEPVISLVELARVVRECDITTLWLTAGLFHQIVQEDPSIFAGIRQFLTGGDVVRAQEVRKVLQANPRATVTNLYGPTENGVITCAHRVDTAAELGESVPIGRPIANTTVYVLDDRQQLVPPGVPGELYTGGGGVALGYLALPEATATRFVSAPPSLGTSGLLYRTGDLVRFRCDGAVEFIGRADRQVKVRGFRIELDEIEAAIAAHPAVRDVAVVARTDLADDKSIVAYFALKAGASEPGQDALKAFLRERLPEYMLPSYFVRVDAMPLDASGKVQRKALPRPAQEPASIRQLPRSEQERAIAAVWCEVLGTSQVDVHANFFDLGGTSLLLGKLHSRLAHFLPGRISVVDLFRAPTVAAMAQHVSADVARPKGTHAESRAAKRRRLAERHGGSDSNTQVTPSQHA